MLLSPSVGIYTSTKLPWSLVALSYLTVVVKPVVNAICDTLHITPNYQLVGCFAEETILENLEFCVCYLSSVKRNASEQLTQCSGEPRWKVANRGEKGGRTELWRMSCYMLGDDFFKLGKHGNTAHAEIFFWALQNLSDLLDSKFFLNTQTN